jgi:hypothetical protein
MVSAQWVLSSILALSSAYIIVLNWVVFARKINGRHAGSWTPLIGGGLGAVALAVSPVEALRGYWWIPLILDWGCLPGFGHALAWNVWHWRSR